MSSWLLIGGLLVRPYLHLIRSFLVALCMLSMMRVFLYILASFSLSISRSAFLLCILISFLLGRDAIRNLFWFRVFPLLRSGGTVGAVTATLPVTPFILLCFV